MKKILEAKQEISKHVVGQEEMVERILIGIFLNGHILLEGLPGLAKSFTVNVLAKVMDLEFKRIQFTPDLLPSDILGTQIYYPAKGEFQTKKGPIFANIVLADEINRSPAKVQSALLEAMQERQVTIGNESFPLDEVFVVLATQNPVEHEGTYPLPEAQQDRFLMKLSIEYQTKMEELEILNRFGSCKEKRVNTILHKKDVLEIRKNISNVHMEDKLKEYIVDIVLKTREASKYILWGASPRATLALYGASKGLAYIRGRDYVIPEDILAVAKDVLRHRIALTYEAELDNMTSVRIIEALLSGVIIP